MLEKRRQKEKMVEIFGQNFDVPLLCRWSIGTRPGVSPAWLSSLRLKSWHSS